MTEHMALSCSVFVQLFTCRTSSAQRLPFVTMEQLFSKVKQNCLPSCSNEAWPSKLFQLKLKV